MATQEEKYIQDIVAYYAEREAEFGPPKNVDYSANNTTPRFQFNNGGGRLIPTLESLDMGEGEDRQSRVGVEGGLGGFRGNASVVVDNDMRPQIVSAGGSLGPVRVDATIPIQAPDWFNLDATMTLDKKKQLAIFFGLTPMEQALFGLNWKF